MLYLSRKHTHYTVWLNWRICWILADLEAKLAKEQMEIQVVLCPKPAGAGTCLIRRALIECNSTSLSPSLLKNFTDNFKEQDRPSAKNKLMLAASSSISIKWKWLSKCKLILCGNWRDPLTIKNRGILGIRVGTSLIFACLKQLTSLRTRNRA